MVVSNTNLLFQGSIFRGELLVSGSVHRYSSGSCFRTYHENHGNCRATRSVNTGSSPPNVERFPITSGLSSIPQLFPSQTKPEVFFLRNKRLTHQPQDQRKCMKMTPRIHSKVFFWGCVWVVKDFDAGIFKWQNKSCFVSNNKLSPQLPTFKNQRLPSLKLT